MQIAARTGAWSGAPLPYDAEVEWIGSDGSSRIMTGVLSTINTECSFDVRLSSEMNEGNIIVGQCSYDDTDYRFFYPTGTCFDMGGRLYQRKKIGDGLFHHIRIGNFYIETDGTRMESSLTPNVASVEIGILGGYGTAARIVNAISGIDIGNLLITEHGFTVRDFTPVRFTNENGISEGAMYDRVSGQLFRNAGTGAFVIGPDK